MAGARTKGVGTGVNWGAFGNIANLLLEGGRARGQASAAGGASLGAALSQFGANKRREKEMAAAQAEREAARAEEMAYRSERDKVGDARWESSHRVALSSLGLQASEAMARQKDRLADNKRLEAQDKAQAEQAKQSQYAAILTEALKSGARIANEKGERDLRRLEMLAQGYEADFKETQSKDAYARWQGALAAIQAKGGGAMQRQSPMQGAGPAQQQPAGRGIGRGMAEQNGGIKSRIDIGVAEEAMGYKSGIEASIAKKSIPEADFLLKQGTQRLDALDTQIQQLDKAARDGKREHERAAAGAEAQKLRVARTLFQTQLQHAADLIDSAEKDATLTKNKELAETYLGQSSLPPADQEAARKAVAAGGDPEEVIRLLGQQYGDRMEVEEAKIKAFEDAYSPDELRDAKELSASIMQEEQITDPKKRDPYRFKWAERSDRIKTMLLIHPRWYGSAPAEAAKAKYLEKHPNPKDALFAAMKAIPPQLLNKDVALRLGEAFGVKPEGR